MTAASRWWTAVGDAVRTGRRTGVLHYVAAILSVQGLAYLTQLVIARVVGPEDFAVVRTVEASLNILLVAASLGMPLLAVTTVAALPDARAQGRMLGTLLAISVIGGVVTAAVASLAAGVLAPDTARYLRILVWVLALSAGSRTCLSYFQGRQQIHRVAGYTVALSVLSLLVMIGAVMTMGLTGWVGGRYLTELLFLALLVWGVGPSLSLSGGLPGDQSLRPLLGAGAGIAISLLIRTAADNAGIYLLTFSGAPAATVGYFGLSSLVLLALLIVPTSIGSVALPRIVAQWKDPPSLLRLLRRIGGGSMLLSIGLAALTAVLARPLVNLAFPSYREAVPLLWILLIAVPFRALSALSGIVLVAGNRVRATVWTNLLALIITCAAGAVATEAWGAGGTAAAVVAGELVSAVIYVTAAWSCLPGRLISPRDPQGTIDA